MVDLHYQGDPLYVLCCPFFCSSVCFPRSTCQSHILHVNPTCSIGSPRTLLSTRNSWSCRSDRGCSLVMGIRWLWPPVRAVRNTLVLVCSVFTVVHVSPFLYWVVRGWCLESDSLYRAWTRTTNTGKRCTMLVPGVMERMLVCSHYACFGTTAKTAGSSIALPGNQISLKQMYWLGYVVNERWVKNKLPGFVTKATLVYHCHS